MSKTMAIFNQKGGVGKTTTVINLAAYIAKKGYKVLIVDIDPQGNSTSGIGIDKHHIDFGLYTALMDKSTSKDSLIESNINNLWIMPSNINLAGAEIELVGLDNREYILKESLSGIKDLFDFIFIDCPPSLGILTINALVASDTIVIPIQCEYFALEGVTQLVNTVQLVKKSLNKTLEIQGVIMNMFDGRNNLSIQVVDEVKQFFKEKVYTTLIPRNVRLAESPSYGLTISEYDPKSKGAVAFEELADEFIEREGKK
jgi:chromosome partitioning protein